MGRPKGGTNKSHSKEEKLELVKRIIAGEVQANISRESGISESQLSRWIKRYLKDGEEALNNKRKPGNPLAKYARKKELTPMEMLEYENALLKRELLRKNIEILKLKKAKEQEGGDV